jgi:Uma2 family endonuclease
MAIAQTPLTLDEFLALPEQKPALEFECGRTIQKMPPQSPSQRDSELPGGADQSCDGSGKTSVRFY